MQPAKDLLPAVAAVLWLFSGSTHAVEFMSAAEVEAAFSGKTTEGHHASKDKTSSSYLSADGTLKGTGGAGTWRVDGQGRLCVGKHGGEESCRFVAKDGDRYKKYKQTGGGFKHVWTYTSLTEGNHKNF